MKPIAGINRDVNPIDQPENTMRYAENGIISEKTGLAEGVQNNLSFDNIAGVNFLGWVLGSYYIYIFGYDLNDHQGVIYRMDPKEKETKELIIVDIANILELDHEAGYSEGILDPEYKENKILQFVYQQDFESHDVIVFAGQVRPKLIDIGAILEDGNYVPPAPVDISGTGYKTNDFLLFPEGGMFNPDATALDTGGNVASGAWMFLYRYVYDDFSTTNWSGVGNAVYISEESFSKDLSFHGDTGNRLATKSISIIVNTDTNQNNNIRIQFAYISIRDRVTYAGILDAKSLTDLLIGGDQAKYIFTGEAPEIDLGDNILELITPRALFKHAGTITSLTSRLYAANLTKQEEINIQEIANAITTTWRMTQGADWKGTALNRPTFGAGEVYALYISVLFEDGSESRGFNIPGRKILAGDNDSIVDGLRRWQLYDTCTPAGDMGFWVNEDERYPNLPEFAANTDIAPYLNGVRHHKMPSLGFLFENGIGSMDRILPELDIEFDNVDLSSLEDNAIGYNYKSCI